MQSMIRIVSVPAGQGFSSIREPYVGCTFRLTDPALAESVRQEYFSGLDEQSPVYWVAFADAIAGLEAARRYDWVNHLQMLQRPKFIRFPIDCAKLIEA